MSALSNLLQLIFGVTIGLTILSLGGVAAGYLFFSRLAVTPERPVFTEEVASSPPVTAAASPAGPAADTAEATEVSAAANEVLEPGAYRMRVTWPDGLSLRAEPELDAEQIGGIAYDEIMIVLESSDDGSWDRVRLPGSDEQGWVKAGNAERIE
ncbi:MAG: SH3 domain-containing protein [Spirulinaceae cyanobacterium SM2_1_0]|nr:SH3 domain-containing protein [Spirulinaceae cyanobacterium SM2_1_0]